MATIGSYAGLNALPLDYYRLALEPVQVAYLMAAYLMLASPFFIAGLVISAVFAARPDKAGPIYFASMTGSAGGAILPVMLAPALGEPLSVILAALLPLVMQPLYFLADRRQTGDGERKGRPSAAALTAAAAVVLVAIGLVSPPGSRFIRIPSSEYKGLDQALRFPQTRVVASYRRLQGHIDQVTGPYLRFAPGLSLKFTGRLPAQQVLYSDRDVPLTLYPPQPEKLAFARSTLSFAAYEQVPAPGRVLVLPQNGGLSLACALAAGADDVQAVIRHPDMADIVRRHYGIPVANDSPRAFAARSAGGFDLIHIENWGSTIPGADALTQNHLLTVDAFEAYLRLLTPDGVLTVSRRLKLPPSDILRLWATAHDALARSGMPEPRRHIVLLRDWGTYTMVVSRRPMKNAEALRGFVDRNGFDLVYLPGLLSGAANRRNELPEPYYYRSVAQLSAAYQKGRSDGFFDTYPLDVAPQTDLRPFPGRLLKWAGIGALYESIGGRHYSLFLSGEIVVMVVLAEALLVTLLLMGIPHRLMRAGNVEGATYQIPYFFGIGCGFMFLEIFFIHLYTFLLGDAVIGFSVVITGLLIFSGLGGLISRMWPLRTVRIVLPALILLIAALLAGSVWCFERLLAFSSPARLSLVLLILVPVGTLVGMPFPIGMRLLAPGPAARAYAWSINGCASVLSAVMAAQLAISFGLGYLLVGAMLAYGLSFAGCYAHPKSPAG